MVDDINDREQAVQPLQVPENGAAISFHKNPLPENGGA